MFLFFVGVVVGVCIGVFLVWLYLVKTNPMILPW